MSRKRGPVETTDYLAMLRRMVRAAGRRVGDADVEDLAELLTLRDAVEAAIADAVQLQRETYGRSWADLARATGTTRQAVQMRYGRTSSPAAPAELDGQLTVDELVADAR